MTSERIGKSLDGLFTSEWIDECLHAQSTSDLMDE
jgi:hypothetical protein